MTKTRLSSFILMAGSVLLCTTALAQTISEVPRRETLIFENIEGRVAVPDNMNPYIMGSNPDWGMWQATQESLFYLNLETGELEPWLAESGSYSDDFQTVTVKLREGVRWSDGVAFTAEDVAFTVDMLKKNTGLQYSGDLNLWVETVEAADPRTVVFHLKNPNPRFLTDYFGVRIWRSILIAPKHVWQDKDPNTFSNYDLEKGWPLGTGPYRLVRSTENETVFDRLDAWWGATTGFHAMPEPKRVIWIGVGTEDTRASLLVNDQLDAAWVMGRETFEIARSRNANIIGWSKDLPYAYLDACPRHLGINNKLPPFDKKEVRRALNDAINRQQIADIAFEKMTEPSYAPFPAYPPLVAFLERNATSVDKVKSDPSKVEALMTAAGYARNADGVWADPAGNGVPVEILVQSGEGSELKVAPILVAQLRAAGFDASSRPVENAVFYSDVSLGRAAAWIGATCGSVQDPYASLDYFTSSNSAEIGKAAPVETTARFENAAYDAAVAKMSMLPNDASGFQAAADEAFGILAEEMPVVPLVEARLLTPFVTTYWTNWPTADNNYIQPGHWWVTGNRLILDVKAAPGQ